MRLISETKYDFDDVLIVPQRSTAGSRKDVLLERNFSFYHSPRSWTGIPIISANMYATGSFAIAKRLSKHKIITCLHKFYTLGELVEFYKYNPDPAYTWMSIGQSDEDIIKLENLCIACPHIIPNIRIDVANGYRENFVHFCKKVRDKFPVSIILAGNICTGDMAQELIIHGGVDIVCCGIGGGCFIKGTKVITMNGKTNIESVKIGEYVLTHTGEYKKVLAKLSRVENEDLININDITCTKNHEFYVIHKNDAKLINEENYHLYAKWISAEELSDSYYLLKITN